VRQCMGAAGFQCQGQIPSMEICNGIDDNCNGVIDEGFPNLNQSCSAGTGACLRFGAFVCNAMHNGTTCNAVAGTAMTEICDGIDNNCNGQIDETFPLLGQQCTAGLGVCQRFGTYQCRADHTDVQCSATPGTGSSEICNYLDDDCNGIVDDGFRDAVTGLYDLNIHDCGSCGNDCTTQFNFVNAHGACTVAGSVASCTMQCNAGTFNLDGFTMDGCYFVLDASGMYVAGDDPTAVDDATCGLGPTGTGAGNHPCLTLTQGLARAVAIGHKNIYVADATYGESIALANGVSMYGGFHNLSWVRHLASTDTTIDGVSSIGNHDMTVIASGISMATTFEGFVVRGSDNAKPSGNSYAIYVSGSNAGLAIQNNQIFAGRGGPGAAGSSGVKGTQGMNGAAYVSATYDSFQESGGVCPAANNRAAFGGGVLTCPGANTVSGGNGGGNNCTPALNTQNSTASSTAANGLAGAGAGGGAAGAAGTRGFDATLQVTTCFLPTNGGGQILPQFGSDGSAGGGGGPAGGVAGCLAPIGSVSVGHWTAGAGPTGNLGSNGGGGGGGGAGGGAVCASCAGTNDMLGGHGGGGGTGGCGGNGGNGGSSGGGAFGIFVFSGSAPTITGNTIALGNGGNGGGGGIGGAGGLGGVGSEGGQIGAFFCTGKGGRGGDGGNGGAGSGGGGGCGGASCGIYTNGVGTPSYCGSNTLSGGAGGTAGSGGFSGGISGGNGAAGVVLNCDST
jgi:hypothetical protein